MALLSVIACNHLPGNGSSGSMAASKKCCNRTTSDQVRNLRLRCTAMYGLSFPVIATAIQTPIVSLGVNDLTTAMQSHMRVSGKGHWHKLMPERVAVNRMQQVARTHLQTQTLPRTTH